MKNYSHVKKHHDFQSFLERDLHKKEESVLQFLLMKMHLQEKKECSISLFITCNGILKKRIDDYPGFQPKIKPVTTYATQCRYYVKK